MGIHRLCVQVESRSLLSKLTKFALSDSSGSLSNCNSEIDQILHKYQFNYVSRVHNKHAAVSQPGFEDLGS